MKAEKFKVLLYLKKSGLDKSGKAPIMGRVTVTIPFPNSVVSYPVPLHYRIHAKAGWMVKVKKRSKSIRKLISYC